MSDIVCPIALEHIRQRIDRLNDALNKKQNTSETLPIELEFIINARQDIPSMLFEIDRLKSERDYYKEKYENSNNEK